MSILEKYNKAMSEKDEAAMKDILHDDFIIPSWRICGF